LQRCGLSQITTRAWTFEEDVAAYAAGGWGAIGVWLQKLEQRHMGAFQFPASCLDSAIVDQAASGLQRARLPVSHVICAGLVTDPDEILRRQRIEHLRFAIDASRRLSAACLVVIPGRLLGQRYQSAFDQACRSLTEVLDQLGDQDVRLAIEPVTEVDFANTLSRALDLVERLDHPLVGVYLDTFHNWQERGLLEQIARAGDRIYGVHVADGRAASTNPNRLIPGHGEINLGEILATIAALGYHGTFDLELLGDDIWRLDPDALLAECARRMDELVADHVEPVAAADAGT
jgi:sugar phosphate isomerase/epimerase